MSTAPDIAHNVISDTQTTYCDSSLAGNATPTCNLPTGTADGTYPAGTSPFVYVQSVLDKAYSWTAHVGGGSNAAAGYVDHTTQTTFIYDDQWEPHEDNRHDHRHER